MRAHAERGDKTRRRLVLSCVSPIVNDGRTAVAAFDFQTFMVYVITNPYSGWWSLYPIYLLCFVLYWLVIPVRSMVFVTWSMTINHSMVFVVSTLLTTPANHKVANLCVLEYRNANWRLQQLQHIHEPDVTSSLKGKGKRPLDLFSSGFFLLKEYIKNGEGQCETRAQSWP